MHTTNTHPRKQHTTHTGCLLPACPSHMSIHTQHPHHPPPPHCCMPCCHGITPLLHLHLLHPHTTPPMKVMMCMMMMYTMMMPIAATVISSSSGVHKGCFTHGDKSYMNAPIMHVCFWGWHTDSMVGVMVWRVLGMMVWCHCNMRVLVHMLLWNCDKVGYYCCFVVFVVICWRDPVAAVACCFLTKHFFFHVPSANILSLHPPTHQPCTPYTTHHIHYIMDPPPLFTDSQGTLTTHLHIPLLHGDWSAESLSSLHHLVSQFTSVTRGVGWGDASHDGGGNGSGGGGGGGTPGGVLMMHDVVQSRHHTASPHVPGITSETQTMPSYTSETPSMPVIASGTPFTASETPSMHGITNETPFSTSASPFADAAAAAAGGVMMGGNTPQVEGVHEGTSSPPRPPRCVHVHVACVRVNVCILCVFGECGCVVGGCVWWVVLHMYADDNNNTIITTIHVLAHALFCTTQLHMHALHHKSTLTLHPRIRSHTTHRYWCTIHA